MVSDRRQHQGGDALYDHVEAAVLAISRFVGQQSREAMVAQIAKETPARLLKGVKPGDLLAEVITPERLGQIANPDVPERIARRQLPW